jgi:hypothetical protein
VTNVLVAWPASATDFSLQQNFDLTGNKWTNAVGEGPLEIVNGQNQLRLLTTNAKSFFRLKNHPRSVKYKRARQKSNSYQFLEAESFTTKGGWVIDPQFMDTMGSPYLMAHGIGKPVENATTTINLIKPGQYKLWVRTKNWTANFSDSPTPGIFKVKINDLVLPFTFGKGETDWHWEEGGILPLPKGLAIISLLDLTGFNGRIDAILLTSDLNYCPPQEKEKLSILRKKWLQLPSRPPLNDKYDLVVVGGGIAGICASVSAARLGLKVALIQNRPVLGGNNSSEVRVAIQGETKTGNFPALGNVVMELQRNNVELRTDKESFEDSSRLAIVQSENNISLFLNYHVFDAKVIKGKIISISARNIENSRELLFKAPLFADCTGDANLGYLCGADYRVGSESTAQTGESLASDEETKQVLGAGLFWWSKEVGTETKFPECPWAYQFTEASFWFAREMNVHWESGFFKDMISNAEEIRDNLLRSIFGNWAFQKNISIRKDEFINSEIAELGYILGKRESRRMLGDVIISQLDLDGQVNYPDGCASTGWYIDIHIPHPENSVYFPGEEFQSRGIGIKHPPFAIPYRCFYSRNIDNLFMAGRHISATHIAHSATRVQRSTGTFGEVVGIASSLCKKLNTSPRGLFELYLPELKEAFTQGVPPGITNIRTPDPVRQK